MGDFLKDPRLELVYENDRPSHFKEKPHGSDTPSISETSASYLQPRKLFNGTLSGYSSPSVASVTSEMSTLVGQSHNGSSEEETTIKKDNISTISKSSTAYGRRLIPQIMDSLAAAEPNRTVLSVAEASGSSLKLREISAQQFVNAVDKTAWWLYNQAGAPDSIEPVGYIGPHDLRHILLTYACVKVGYAALYLSPKNSTDGAVAVLKATKCNIWVKCGELTAVPLVNDILQQRPMQLLELPLLNELLDAESTVPFQYTKTFEEAITDPFCFLHTSGSTGVPKPIPWSHGLIGTMDAVRLLSPTEGDGGLVPWTTDWKSGDRIYSSFPMCHVCITLTRGRNLPELTS
jgi:long-subunit acyl-CoA synthetase (AMP-forming)